MQGVADEHRRRGQPLSPGPPKQAKAPSVTTGLTRYGGAELWRRTLHHLDSASPHLPAALAPLVQLMRQTGLALEQDAVWLD